MATVDRVLPWRRHTRRRRPTSSPRCSPRYRQRHPKAPIGMITRAYELAAEAHADQHRKTGETYINHPLAVATHRRRPRARRHHHRRRPAARRRRGHRGHPRPTSRREFGAEVAAIVDGVTKLERLQFDSKEAQQAATMRKMLVAMAKDLRVLIIKLADRLHNMRTLAAMPPEKQQRIAQETLDIYAPLAHRLGMQEIKQQLEDLAFAALHPKRYAEIDHMVATRTPERDLTWPRCSARSATGWPSSASTPR